MSFDNKHLLEGSVTKSIFKLSLPIILSNLLQTAYNLTDTFWVGRLGPNAVASVSISFPIIFLLISIGSGLALAGTILVSQYQGKKDQQKVNHISTQTILLTAIFALLISVIGYLISPLLLSMMGAEQTVYNDAVSYLQIIFLGMISLFMFGVFQSLLRGVGDAKTPLYVILFTVILNLILDPLLIFGFWFIPPQGVVGAAYATIATQTLAAIIGIGMLLSSKHSIHIKPKNFKPDFKLMKRMFLLGLPASIEQSMRALGMTIMTFLVTSFGTITIAAYGIGTRILSFIIIPAIGISIATSTLVGQNIGAGKPKRAKQITKISSELSFVILTSVGIILFIFSNQIAEFFIPNELEVITSSSLFIRIMALTFGFIGFQQALLGAFRGAGNTIITMVLSIISLWIFQFPFAYILSHNISLGEIGIWLSFPISNELSAIVAIIWYKKRSLKENKPIFEDELAKEVMNESVIDDVI